MSEDLGRLVSGSISGTYPFLRRKRLVESADWRVDRIVFRRDERILMRSSSSWSLDAREVVDVDAMEMTCLFGWGVVKE